MKIIFLLIFDAAVHAAHQITAQTQLDKFLRSVSSKRVFLNNYSVRMHGDAGCNNRHDKTPRKTLEI